MTAFTVKNGASVIPAGTRVIEARAFYGDGALETLTVPEGVESIGDNAFTNCRALKRVTLPESLRSLGAGAFRWCALLPRAALPEGVEAVPDECFFGCEALEALTLPSSLRAVGAWAFFGCAALRELRFPETLERAGAGAFRACTALERAELPEGLREIEEKAFFECAALRAVRIPAALERLGEEAFGACNALERFEGSAAGPYPVRDGVLFADGGATLLRYPPAAPESAYAVPEGTRAIAPGAFQGAGRLRELTLPQSLRSVGPMAFSGTALPFLRLPEGVEPGPGLRGLEGAVTVCTRPEQALWLARPVLLGEVSALPERARGAAVAGFLWAIEHGLRGIEPWREGYLACIREDIERYLAFAPGDETLLHLLLEEGLVPPEMLPDLLDDAAEKGRTDLTAELLDYRRRCLPPEAQPGDALSLEDDPGTDALNRNTPGPEDALKPKPAPIPPPPTFYGTGDA